VYTLRIGRAACARTWISEAPQGLDYLSTVLLDMACA
jgi:hypothetical protein